MKARKDCDLSCWIAPHRAPNTDSSRQAWEGVLLATQGQCIERSGQVTTGMENQFKSSILLNCSFYIVLRQR